MTASIDHITSPQDSPREHVSREIAEQFEAYSTNPELLELIARLADVRGIDVPDPTESEESFWKAANRALNFRQGKKREDVKGSDFPQEVKDLTENLIEQFDMRLDTEPKNPDFDAIMVLGAAGRTPIDRLNYALELQEQDKLRAPALVMVAGERPVDAAEVGRANAAGLELDSDSIKTEFDLMRDIAAAKYGIAEWKYLEGDDPNVPHEHDFHTTYRIAYANKDGQEIMVLSAPMIDEDRYDPEGNLRNRANTVDSLLFAARFMGAGRVDSERRFALVTNAVFVPSQDADGKKALTDYGVGVETVGMNREHTGLPEWNNGDPAYYMQEMLSAIRQTKFARDRLVEQ